MGYLRYLLCIHIVCIVAERIVAENAHLPRTSHALYCLLCYTFYFSINTNPSECYIHSVEHFFLFFLFSALLPAIALSIYLYARHITVLLHIHYVCNEDGKYTIAECWSHAVRSRMQNNNVEIPTIIIIKNIEKTKVCFVLILNLWNWKCLLHLCMVM